LCSYGKSKRVAGLIRNVSGLFVLIISCQLMPLQRIKPSSLIVVLAKINALSFWSTNRVKISEISSENMT
jgi:hypothetical protein